MKLRLVKMTDLRDYSIFYQIQKKTFFGWIAIGNRFDGIKSTFDDLEEAKNYYNAYNQKEVYKTEIIES